METVFTLGNAITLLIAGVGIAVNWGILTQRMKNVEDHRTGCEKRFDSIERDHTSAIKDMQTKMENISNSLHELIGMVKIYMTKEK
jgi:hypothetical protein